MDAEDPTITTSNSPTPRLLLFLHQQSSTMTLSFESTAFQSLKDALTSSLIFTPDSEGYQDSLRRWSDTGVKPAVRPLTNPPPPPGIQFAH